MERSGMKSPLLQHDFSEAFLNEKEDSGFSSGYDSSGTHDSLDSGLSDSFTEVVGGGDNAAIELCSVEMMRYHSTKNLSDQLQYIVSMPELCDITFHVGPNKETIHGVKAILGTRSRIMYQLILKKQREIEEERKSSKKFRKSPRNPKTIIEVSKYQAEDFREIIKFMHCGIVDINAKNVVGILCGASQFDLSDLKTACWSFISKSMTSQPASVQTILNSAQKYAEHRTTEKLICNINKRTLSSKVTDLRLPVKQLTQRSYNVTEI